MLFWEQQPIINELNKNWVWVEDWIDSSAENTAGRLVSFKTDVVLDDAPIAAHLHISADTRYKLRVNGERVAVGPSRGSPYVWYYDTVDITRHLKPGSNEVHVEVVRYFAANRAAMPFERTSFPGLTIKGEVRCSGGTAVSIATTEGEWKVSVRGDVKFPTGAIDDGFLHIYERIAAASTHETVTTRAKPYGFKTLNGDLLPWRLQPRPIPMPEETIAAFDTVNGCQSSIERPQWISWLHGECAIHLDPLSEHTIDIQAAEHYTAFLKWRFKAEADTAIRLSATYSEGYELEPVAYPYFRAKADRLNAERGRLLGPSDEVNIPVTGGEETKYEPFWFRTFRIMRLKIVVGEKPVQLLSMNATQTNYPLDIKGSWTDVDDTQSTQMWDVSIRTLRNCMYDGYSDCPFYEQLQYSMDSRAVGLFHYLLSGDDRLIRQSLVNFAASTTAEGLTQSRFPSHVNQLIAAFPLYFILQICDHHLYFGDTKFTRSFIPRVDGILQFFEQYIDERGLVANLPADVWQFVDWVTSWHATDEHPDKGVPTSGRKTNLHTYFSLLLAYVLQQAANLLHQVGRPGNAAEYLARATSLQLAVRKHCFDGTFFTDSTADVGDGPMAYSQHCQVFAILSGTAAVEERAPLLKAAFAPESTLSKCSYMMQFYTLRAFALAGDEEYEAYYRRVWDPWRKMLDNNLSTWEEDDVRHRSDCHAWGSVPIYEFATEVAGIQVAEAGCKKILFKPRVKLSREIHGKIALGQTNLASVDWKWSEDKASVTVSLSLQEAIEVDSQLPGQTTAQSHGLVKELQIAYTGSFDR